jgi:hypothetical protein
MEFDLERGLRELADDASRGTRVPVVALGRRLRRRRATRAATVAVAATATVAGLVTGAAGLADLVRRPDATAPVATAVPTPTPSTSSAPVASTTPTPAPTPTPTVPPVAAEPMASAPAVPSAPTPPRPSAEVHGSTAWAVYVAVSPQRDDAALAADARLTAMGYTQLRGGDLACDRGAAEALGRDPSEHAVAVYFDTEADAALFAELYGDGVVGTVQVTLRCRD